MCSQTFMCRQQASKDQRSPSILTRELTHTFGIGEASFRVLQNVNLTINQGEFILLMGPSGSGKTTLLTLIGCLRSVQEGSAQLFGHELRGASAQQLMNLRHRLGFIFQAHNLHNSLTALQNVRMGLEVHGKQKPENWREACEKILELVGLAHRNNHLPANLSGGQKQRVAVARALVSNPEVVFADEPTAALDKESGHQIIHLLRRLADERKTTVVMVTHDHRVLDFADRIVRMEDGRIVS